VVVFSVPSSSFSSLFLLPSLLFLSIALVMQSQRRRFFSSRFDEIKDFEDGRKALLLATKPLVEERHDDEEEHPRVWEGRKVSKTPIIIYIWVCVKSPTPQRRGKSDKTQKIFLFKSNCVWRRKSTPLREKEQKKNAAQTSDSSLEYYQSFRAVFTVNASVVEETRALTFCFFSTTKVGEKKRYF